MAPWDRAWGVRGRLGATVGPAQEAPGVVSPTKDPMKPPPFEYHAVASVDEAVSLLGDLGDEAKVLAGGQSLVPLLALRLARPAHLVDINGLADLATVANGNGLVVGALVRHRVAERSPVVRRQSAGRRCPRSDRPRRHPEPGDHRRKPSPTPIPQRSFQLCSSRSRVRSTDEPAWGPAGPGSELFHGFLTTSLAPDELLTAVRFPAWPTGTGWSFQEFSRRSGDFAIAGAAATVRLDASGLIGEARIALSGVASTPVRATGRGGGAHRSATLGGGVGSGVGGCGHRARTTVDVHGSAGYRRHLVGRADPAALRQAHERAEVRS